MKLISTNASTVIENHRPKKEENRANDAPHRLQWGDRTFSAHSLQKMEFPPLNYLLPGLVPEGLCLLVGQSLEKAGLCLISPSPQRSAGSY